MIITTGPNIEGKTITEYKGLIFVKSSAPDNVNLFSDKPKNEYIFEDWTKEAYKRLEQKASGVGANAVVGVRMEIVQTSGTQNMVLIGTAVTVS